MCNTYPDSKVSNMKCVIKYIDRKNIKIDMWANVTKQIERIWAIALMYYKYNTYQRIAVNLWEDICGWFSGKTKSYIMDWTFGRVLNYTNLNHHCPYNGHVYLKVDNVSIDRFPFPPIIPSGRYRI